MQDERHVERLGQPHLRLEGALLVLEVPAHVEVLHRIDAGLADRHHVGALQVAGNQLERLLPLVDLGHHRDADADVHFEEVHGLGLGGQTDRLVRVAADVGEVGHLLVDLAVHVRVAG